MIVVRVCGVVIDSVIAGPPQKDAIFVVRGGVVIDIVVGGRIQIDAMPVVCDAVIGDFISV